MLKTIAVGGLLALLAAPAAIAQSADAAAPQPPAQGPGATRGPGMMQGPGMGQGPGMMQRRGMTGGAAAGATGAPVEPQAMRPGMRRVFGASAMGRYKGFDLRLGDGRRLRVACGNETLSACVESAGPLLDLLEGAAGE